ncbi:MAG TPA: ABC transporter permease [Solirubrobacteraceae bacterium]|nr:ABC transporter permease [Solirubrobacteraceae bacterium]
MSTLKEELVAESEETGGAAARTPATLTAFRRGLSGVAVPILTAVIAFVAGGLIVLATGHNPLTTYSSIFDGTGLNWLFPWVSGSARATAAGNLQQTLLQATPLLLVGLAVAFAFRAGLFNIGGQGQYTVGGIVAVWVGSSFRSMDPVLHIAFAIVAAGLAGAAWGGIAGFLKATTGANEVISTIMLNWVAIWFGVYCFQLGGPLHSPARANLTTPVSSSVVAGAKLPVFWGSASLQGLDVGIFVAVGLAVVYAIIIKRTRLGFEARAVGFNPAAAESAGMSAGRTWVRVMLICGAFAGIAASLDILGWKFNLFTNDVQTSQVGAYGIAVALLGRNTASGTAVAALLWGALLTGTSNRNINLSIDPTLVQYLTFMIEGLIVLLVSTDVITLRLLRGGRRIGVALRRRPVVASADSAAGPDRDGGGS